MEQTNNVLEKPWNIKMMLTKENEKTHYSTFSTVIATISRWKHHLRSMKQHKISG
jgi:hypothetical protein